MMTPWFGRDTVTEFLKDESNGVAIYVHDSNPSAFEFQDIELSSGKKLYEELAYQIANKWNTNGNVFVEAGATYPEQLRRTREIIGENMVILTAGIGTQGGKVEDLKGVFGKNGKRLLVNSSRDIIFAGRNKGDYFLEVKKATEALRQELILVSTELA